MSIEFDTIPASIRKPGVYMEFNTSLAQRNLPTNKQSVCLLVPLGNGATVDANVPTQFYSAPEAKALFGGTIAEEMAHAFITAYRYAAVSAVGVVVEGDVEPDIKPALDATAQGGFTILVPAWNSSTALTALREHIKVYTNSMEQQGIIGVAALTSTLSAATTLATSLNSGAISLAVLPGTASKAHQVSAAYAAMIASEEDPARPLNTLEQQHGTNCAARTHQGLHQFDGAARHYRRCSFDQHAVRRHHPGYVAQLRRDQSGGVARHCIESAPGVCCLCRDDRLGGRPGAAAEHPGTGRD